MELGILTLTTCESSLAKTPESMGATAAVFSTSLPRRAIFRGLLLLLASQTLSRSDRFEPKIRLWLYGNGAVSYLWFSIGDASFDYGATELPIYIEIPYRHGRIKLSTKADKDTSELHLLIRSYGHKIEIESSGLGCSLSYHGSMEDLL
jgi:hypothetical protein